jgi:hypothetical protein
MHEGFTYLSLIVAFGFVLIAGARLGAGSHTGLAGLFPAHAGRDWPTGVQEPDAPHFAVVHLDALRPGTPVLLDGPAIGGDAQPDEPQPEVIELFDRPLRDGPSG